MEDGKKENPVPVVTPVTQAVEKKEPVKNQNQKTKEGRPEVITVRTWKEYLGESALIVFSVILALASTEWFAKLHEEKQIREVLHQLRDELITNETAEKDQFQYHQKIIRRLDSALTDTAYAHRFISDGIVHLEVIIDSGVLRHDLNDVAWQIAKENNVFSKLDLPTYSLLTDIYANQQKIANAENEIGKLLLSWESRKPENLRTTIILIRDTYIGWATGRAPLLLANYKNAIAELSKY